MIDINELDESKKYLIISDACYRNVLWSLKSSHPQLNFKLITKEELIGMINFDYIEELRGVSPIAFLLKEGKEDYSTLSRLLRVLRLVGTGKDERLDEIYALLSKEGYIRKDSLGMRELSLYDKVFLFESDEDVEIKKLLNDHD